jgi:hypothetical protein
MRDPPAMPLAPATSIVRLAGVCLLTALAHAQSQPAHIQEARALLQKGANAEVIALLEPRLAEHPNDGQAWFFYGHALHSLGRYEEAFAAHARAAGLPKAPPVASYNAACALARLGRVDEAFAWLAKARAAGFVNWNAAATDADLTTLRDDPRFEDFLPPPADTREPFVERAAILHDLVGEAAGDQFGWVARALGDVDGDGRVDYAVTAPFHGGGRGAVHVHSGASGERLYVLRGESGEQLGWCVAGIADLDGDGRAEVVAGAPGSGAMPGAVHVFSGADGKLLRTLRGEAAGDLFGTDARGVGDQDGDGVADLLVGAPKHDGPAGADAGRATLHSLRDGRVLRAFDGEAAGDELGGGELAGFRLGQTSRLAVAALEAGPQRRGRVYVWNGAGELVFTLEGDANSNNLGWFVSVIGDLDGDGTPDLYASDWHDVTRGPLTGKVRVVSGGDGRVLLELVGTRAGEGFGIGVATAGDLDRDGRPDLAIGSWQCAEAAPSGGKVTLYSGRDGARLGTATGRIPGDAFGFDADGVGDVDGDGVVDLLLTAAYNGARGEKAGRAYVVSGASLLAQSSR